MAFKKIYDVVATIGEYTNKKGETKRHRLNCGKELDVQVSGHSRQKADGFQPQSSEFDDLPF